MPKTQTRPKQAAHLPPPHSYTLSPLDANDDDDDICPVCESECTCAGSAPSAPAPVPPSVANPFKIRLTLTAQPGAPPDPPPKKRGRPSKSNVHARESAAASVRAKHASKSTLPLPRKPSLPTAKKNRHPPLKKIPERPTPRPRKQPVAPLIYVPSSDENDEDDAGNSTDLSTPGRFPTFVSASVLDSSSSDDSDQDSSSDTSSDSSSLSSLDSDSIADEEEQLIVAEAERDRDRARVKRELLEGTPDGGQGNGHGRRNWDEMNWGRRARRKASSVADSDASLDISDDDSDDEDSQSTDDDADAEDDEAEDEADADADAEGVSRGAEFVMAWSSSEEDYDAEFFFANLSDSSFAFSSDDEGGTHHAHRVRTPHSAATKSNSSVGLKDEDASSDLDELSLTEAAHAGLLPRRRSGRRARGSARLPLVITEDWDGELVFTTGLKDGEGVLDRDFEAAVIRTEEDAIIALGGGDTSNQSDTTDSENGGDDDEDDEDEEDEEMDFYCESDGDTTAEEYILNAPPRSPVGTNAPFVFRFPAPRQQSVDPRSTVSSPGVSPHSSFYHPAGAGVILGGGDATSTVDGSSPRPADILAGAGRSLEFLFGAAPPSPITEEASEVGGESVGTSVQFCAPPMGCFIPEEPRSAGKVVKTFVVDGSPGVIIPSPYAHLKRKWDGPKRRGVSSDASPHDVKRFRRSSLSRLSYVHSRRQSGASISDSSPDDPAPTPAAPLPPAPPVELHDVLDPAVLDEHHGEEHEEEEDEDGDDSVFGSSRRHVQSWNRWDRVPMGMFRRSRTATARIGDDGRPGVGPTGAGVGVGVGAVGGVGPGVGVGGQNHGSTQTTRVSDGFSYGGTPSSAGLPLRSPFSPAHAQPLGSMVWDSDAVGGGIGIGGGAGMGVGGAWAGRKRRGRSRKRKRVDISPVIFPVAESTVGPSAGSGAGAGQVHKGRVGRIPDENAGGGAGEGMLTPKAKRFNSTGSLSSPFVLDRKSVGVSGVVPPLSLAQ
ncbi:hypothetical protein BOTBODRAFT_181723 [Botryobasidium botryosum FD-172 SS1]|uniref:Uncharacterized protein n=1 Tax=Botryobasidium botryosum (strain FD-172 SS1) TaxID=930990 RepID=A0A067LTB1_BOTB1|nr:hypothetical protein BOTBODRAFT_181723 [Botryobasidium botryosum FD-172 SS1]